MPSRTFFDPSDQKANLLALEAHIGERSDHALSLAASNVAPLVDVASISYLLGVSSQIIFSITTKKDRHYRSFSIEKKSGKCRQIDAPRTYLKVVQWWILDNILFNQIVHPQATGFVRGRGIYDNAAAHLGARNLLNMDLRNFFPSIREHRVASIFAKMGYGDEVSLQLASICTYRGVLPQGAPTSPTLANLAAGELDRSLELLARHSGYRYTRYADDVTFSSDRYIPDDFADQAARLISSLGFEENRDKRRFSGPGQRLSVTGLSIHQRVNPSREWRRNARALVHQVTKSPLENYHKLPELQGIIGLLIATRTPLDNRLLTQARRAVAAAKESQRASIKPIS